MRVLAHGLSAGRGNQRGALEQERNSPARPISDEVPVFSPMLMVISPLHQLFESRALLLSQRPIASILLCGANRAASSPTTSACREQSLGLRGWSVVLSRLCDHCGGCNGSLVYVTRSMGIALAPFQNNARMGHAPDLFSRWDRYVAKSARCCGLGRRCSALGRRCRRYFA